VAGRAGWLPARGAAHVDPAAVSLREARAGDAAELSLDLHTYCALSTELNTGYPYVTIRPEVEIVP
jgi:hypothetical protein